MQRLQPRAKHARRALPSSFPTRRTDSELSSSPLSSSDDSDLLQHRSLASSASASDPSLRSQSPPTVSSPILSPSSIDHATPSFLASFAPSSVSSARPRKVKPGSIREVVLLSQSWPTRATRSQSDPSYVQLQLSDDLTPHLQPPHVCLPLFQPSGQQLHLLPIVRCGWRRLPRVHDQLHRVHCHHQQR